MESFTEETEVDERAIRRLAASKGCEVNRANGQWTCCGITMDDDEIWAVLENF